ncbi:MAG: hypothetical protein IJ087_08055 [Eggerthellaceae bacterium]|nr:hypothetical protein [Eggerthellaceae bacterium]
MATTDERSEPTNRLREVRITLRHDEGIGRVLQQREERHRAVHHEHCVGEQLLQGRHPLLGQQMPPRVVMHERKHDVHGDGRSGGDEVRQEEGAGALAHGEPDDVIAGQIRTRQLVGERLDDLRIGIFGRISLGQREALPRKHYLDIRAPQLCDAADFVFRAFVVNLGDDRVKNSREQRHRLGNDAGVDMAPAERLLDEGPGPGKAFLVWIDFDGLSSNHEATVLPNFPS